MIERAQDKLLMLGKYGCYLMCLLSVAEEEKGVNMYPNILLWYDIFLDKGWIEEDCYILRPEKILEYLTGKKWNVRWESKDYVREDKEFIIENWRYERSNHFCRTAVDYNSVKYSRCVSMGKIDSVRVCKKLN